MFYLSEAPLPSYDAILPPLFTLYSIHVQYVLTVYLVYLFSHRGGGGELSSTEKVRGTIVHKSGSKIPTRLSIKHQ